MDWITLDETKLLADFPTDLRPKYDEWLAANPDKSGRLSEIAANTVAEIRESIRSNPENTLDPDPAKVPQAAFRHAETIAYFQLAMEMGVDIDSEAMQAMTRADMFLRMIAYNHFSTKGGDGTGEPSPHYTPRPATAVSNRALPAVLALLVLLFAAPARGAWIAQGRGVSDQQVTVTFTPTAYTNASTMLFGHLSGINAILAALAANDSLAVTGVVRIAGSTMTGALTVPSVRGPENAHLTIEAGGAISYAPTLYLRAGTNATSRGYIKVSAQALQAENEYDFHIQGGYSPFQGRSVILQGGEAGGLNPRGSVVIKGDASLQPHYEGATPAKLWTSTNSYLSALGSLTSLYFVVVNPPSTNRIDL
jgi:hypothetical protein